MYSFLIGSALVIWGLIDDEPKKTPRQKREPENDPAPLPKKTKEKAPEPEPEPATESVPVKEGE